MRGGQTPGRRRFLRYEWTDERRTTCNPKPLANNLTSDIRTRLEAILRDVFDDEQLSATDSLNQETLEGWDSLGHIRLIAAMEEGFGLTFTLEEIEAMSGVPQIVATISAKA